MSDILNKIISVKRDEIAAAKRKRTLTSLRVEAENAALPRDFLGALRERLGSFAPWRCTRRWIR